MMMLDVNRMKIIIISLKIPDFVQPCIMAMYHYFLQFSTYVIKCASLEMKPAMNYPGRILVTLYFLTDQRQVNIIMCFKQNIHTL